MSVSSVYNEDRVNITHVEGEKKYSGSHSPHSSLHAYQYRALISNPCDLSNERYSSNEEVSSFPTPLSSFHPPFGGFQNTLTNF